MKPKYCKCMECGLEWRSNIHHNQKKCPKCMSRQVTRKLAYARGADGAYAKGKKDEQVKAKAVC